MGLKSNGINSITSITYTKRPLPRKVDTSVDALSVKASTERNVFIGEFPALLPERLKAVRKELGLSQQKMAGQLCSSVRAYQGYEDGRSLPGSWLISAYVELGINANWLLAGKGPMLLADLSAPAQVAAEPPPPAPAPRINVDALAHAYAVTLQTAPKGETLAQSAKKAVAFYQFCFDQGLITEDGEADGNLSGAA